MRYELNSELERIEFMIALTERANTNGSLDNQLNRLVLAYLAELSGIPYSEIIDTTPEPKQTKTITKPMTEELSDEAVFH